MTNLVRSNFQDHPFHLVSPSPWPLYTSISLFTLTVNAALSMHLFNNSYIFFYVALITVVVSMTFWFRDIISEGTYLGNHTLAVQKGLNLGVIVRRCAAYLYGLIKSEHCFWMFPATGLGKGESPELNIAFHVKGEAVKTDWYELFQAEVFTNKDWLLESHLLGASSLRAASQSGKDAFSELVFNITKLIRSRENQDRISIHNVESGSSKKTDKQICRTTGLPTVRKNYGNRGIIVPGVISLYNEEFTTGRRPVIATRTFSTSTEGFSNGSTNAVEKIRKIAELCKENPDFVVTDKLYRLLYDKKLYYIAYEKLKSKPGNMTPGIVPTTLDGMSTEVIAEIVEKIKNESFEFKPGRRVHIPKANGKTRPLTIAPPRDKIVQESIRMILEAIYEPAFSDNSHGFRPNRSCHSTLKTFNQKFRVAKWFIEGDITKCFDSIDHNMLIGVLEERVKDRKFINLIRKALKAGYFEFNRLEISLAGTPQGSIISPILANIFLDKLDKFVEHLKINFDVGERASINPVWKRMENAMYRAKDIQEKVMIRKEMLKFKSKLAVDPSFKKLVYIRYADDWVIGVRGSREDCNFILSEVRIFLQEKLKLSLSEDKTKITNSKHEVATFLSVNIRMFKTLHYRRVKGRSTRTADALRLTAPIDKIVNKLKTNGFMKEEIPAPKFIWLANSKDEIILLYNSVYRGITNYYRFVHNFNELSSRVHHILKSSCAKLLAAKFTLKSQARVFELYGKDFKGKDKHSFIKATYGNKPSAFNTSMNDVMLRVNASGISKASLENLTCSICESSYRVEMHHVRHMKDLNPKARFIDKLMARRNRKQIPLCRNCHLDHHKAMSMNKDTSQKVK